MAVCFAQEFEPVTAKGDPNGPRDYEGAMAESFGEEDRRRE